MPQLYESSVLTKAGGFTEGIEGPSCGPCGDLYVCNFARDGTVGKVTSGTCDVFLNLPVGSIGNGMVFSAEGLMYIADHVGHNVYRVDTANKAVSVHAREETMHQPNDLAVMRSGIIFASDPQWSTSEGQLWRVDPDGTTHLLETRMGTTNGVEVSPDETALYVNETVQRRVWVYDLDPGGKLSNKRLHFEFPDHGLDGMRCDITGDLYITRYGGGVIAVVSPAGHVKREVALYGKSCTNVAFGGPDGRSLFVTLADARNIEMFRTEYPGRSWELLRGARERLGT